MKLNPPEGNLDGPFNPNTHRRGAGGVLRDSDGTWIRGYSKHLPYTTAV